ncbi:MAG: class I SAM-dependent methyltransferase [Candidatus Eisenbacteria bacterium]
MDANRTEIERWILANLTPQPSTTAELMYERMESQSGRCLPVLYEPLDNTKRSHWHDEALIGAFAHAMGDASVILDVGPGDGWPALRIAHRFKKIIGIDPSPRRVRVQCENAERLGIDNVEFRVMDAEEMSFRNGSFGGVTAASSIEQCANPEQALREVFRVLTPGGTLAMIFEDYDVCFADSEGDEKLRGELTDGEAVVFYQVRRKSPPRETWYALFLDRERLNADPEFLEAVENISETPVELDGAAGGDGFVAPAETFGVTLLVGLAPFIADTKYFELNHLTSGTVNELLARVGFVEMRHLDHRLPELLAFYDAALKAGKLGENGPVLDIVAEVFGISAVERAGERLGDFVLAKKPG